MEPAKLSFLESPGYGSHTGVRQTLHPEPETQTYPQTLKKVPAIKKCDYSGRSN